MNLRDIMLVREVFEEYFVDRWEKYAFDILSKVIIDKLDKDRESINLSNFPITGPIQEGQIEIKKDLIKSIFNITFNQYYEYTARRYLEIKEYLGEDDTNILPEEVYKKMYEEKMDIISKEKISDIIMKFYKAEDQKIGSTLQEYFKDYDFGYKREFARFVRRYYNIRHEIKIQFENTNLLILSYKIFANTSIFD